MELALWTVALCLLVTHIRPLTWARKATGRAQRSIRVASVGLLLILAVLLAASGAYSFWIAHRPLPGNTRQVVFEGITYIREVRRSPRPIVIHVMRVELDAPGIRFLVTPGDPSPEDEIRARTTSQFVAEFDLQVAINGDFFTPWWSYGPWDYYPRVGDPIDVKGFASSNGAVYSGGESNDGPTLYLSAGNQASFDVPIGSVYNAISGNTIFLEDGVARVEPPEYHFEPHPRTAIALDRARRTLILVVVDGRQPNYSEGISLAELAQILRDYGGDTALNLDGGGSTTMVIEGDNGEPVILNSPIDNLIPGRERPVANHLGIYAHPASAP
ncbi:MAG TPA: phosphodiester glycosidase family protein [Anaerolineae bacterium]|nr:phosphodiester glycosidase family protein [Anaerolineae bacterium]